MNGLNRRHGLRAWSITCGLIFLVSACAEDTATPPTAPPSDGAGGDSVGDALLTQDGAGATDPKIVISSLDPAGTIQVGTIAAPETTSVTVTVTVTNTTVGPGGHKIRYYLDGSTFAEVNSADPFSFTGLQFGRRHLAARLVTQGGDTLPNAESLDDKYKIIKVAGCAEYQECDDGLSCSNEQCNGGVCNWGPKPNCCDSDLECPYAWYCPTPGGECIECLDASDCDDGDFCTIDSCDGAGACVHEVEEGCCHEDSDCDDGDYCTIDSCGDGDQCQHVDNGEPLCCNTNEDCKPADPCMAYLCYLNFKNGSRKCRYGPSKPSCCVDPSDCDDGNPCTLNLCPFDEVTEDAGTCVYQTDPATQDTCCVSNTDCDDDDASTSDSCEDNECVHEEDPLYCELPPTSVIVINEIMAAPGAIEDSLGEWIELYNAGEDVIDLNGWRFETTGGGFHVLDATGPGAVDGNAALQLFPDSYVVLARNADSALNGGFLPNYEYGGDLSLPDPFDGSGITDWTVTLKDGAGEVVDEVIYNTDTWNFEDGASLSLIHPHADNLDPLHWLDAGSNVDPAKNKKYGNAANNLYGTPKNINSDILQALAHQACVPGEDSHPCAEGACSIDNQCEFPLEDGCCVANADCDDFDSCTEDSCDVFNQICNVSSVDPECCDADDDCNDNDPCNLDRCIGGTCRYSLNVVDNCCTKDSDCDDDDQCTTNICDEASHVCNAAEPITLDGGQQCCNHDDDCDDAEASTVDICDFGTEPPTCIHAADPDYCTSPDDPCDDDNNCTADSCDVGAQQCIHNDLTGCCQKNSDCLSDNNPCTAEVCDVDTGNCSSYEISDCCIGDNDCTDGNKCTVDSCGSSNVCHNNPVDDCCNSSAECDDDYPCTLDSCVNDTCENTQQSACCTPGDSAQTLINMCGSDPDGPATCFVWECTEQGQCNLLQNDTCCSKHSDCDDGDPCTQDSCTTDNVCKHVDQQDGACCILNEDCPDADGKTCTDPVCDDNFCTEKQINGCHEPVVPPLNYGPNSDENLEDDGFDPGSAAVSCWRPDTSGYLGPDAHAECFGNSGEIGDEGILSAPSFNPNGEDFVSVQFRMAWKNDPGTHTVTVLASSKEHDYDGAEVLDVITVDGENAGTLYTYEISNFMAAQKGVWVGWKVESDNKNGVDVTVDDFTAGAGHSPFFIQDLHVNKKYDTVDDRLVDGGTITGELGETKKKVFWAHDEQWESEKLTFELLNAPSFVTIDDTAKLNVYGVYQVKIKVEPLTADQIGTYDVTLRVADDAFVDEIPVNVVVDLGAGYVVWEPLGVAAADGDALANALSALGHTFQRVNHLDNVSDWSQVYGLFVTAGGGNTKKILTNSAVKLAVDYMDDFAGDVYLEGSATFVEDSQTSLQARFKVSPVDTDGGIFGPMKGMGINYGGTWEYTNNPTYYNDVDTISPTSGSGGRQAMARESDDEGLAVTFDNSTNGSRTYGATFILSQTNELTSPKEDIIANVVDFFENGYGSCEAHDECADGDPCTIDECIGGNCKNTEDLFCDLCQSDSDCPDGLACKANGDCVSIPGDIVGEPIEPELYNCNTTDERVTVVKNTSGFTKITNVNVQVKIQTDESQKLGTHRIRLGHNGVVVTLLETDKTNSDTLLFTTYDLGTMPILGSMDDFNGTLVEGDWMLEVEDTTGGEACGTIEVFDIYVETEPLPACEADIDCTNNQLCDGTEICNAGNCELGVPPVCEDGDPCTKDKCDSFQAQAAGMCVSLEREPSCAGAACTGTHAVDAGDGNCGILDACVGGLDAGDGICKLVCDQCDDSHSGEVNTQIEDFQCITEKVDVVSDKPYTADVYLRTDVTHENLGDLELKLFTPSNSGVTVLDGDGDGLADYHSTFPLSNPAGEEALCGLNGTDPSGTWKVQICDNRAESEGSLRSWSLWVLTSDDNPNRGQDCEDPNVVTEHDDQPCETSENCDFGQTCTIGGYCADNEPKLDGTVYSFTGSTKCFADSTMGACSGNDGHDVIYQFDLLNERRVTANLTTPSYDSAIYITTSCSPGSDKCSDTGGVGDNEQIDTILGLGSYYVVVDALNEDGWGDYTLDLQFAELLANGQVCDEGLDCQSGHCANGYCCTSGDCCPGGSGADECPGQYRAAAICSDTVGCQGHETEAVCQNFICDSSNVDNDEACTTGTESKDCGLFTSVFCDGTSDQQEPLCLEECTDNSQCDDGSHCYELTHECRLDNPEGTDCQFDYHCSSGHCVDGVCCDSGCSGLCEQCDRLGFVGSCVFRKAFTDPDEECAGTGLCGGVCDGEGACSYEPDSTNCDTCTRCDGAGFCANFTADDTDIDDSCAICQVCDGTGACRNVENDRDPLAECIDQGAGGCGQDGTCDGSGSCRLYAEGTVCVSQSCTNGYIDPAHECDGLGVCENFTDQWCDGHICGGSECQKPCDNDAGCMTGYFCCAAGDDCDVGIAIGACQEKKDNGDACGEDHECTSNFCTDGVCCNTPCVGACRQCDGGAPDDPSPVVGECFDHLDHTDPETGCGTYWCSGTGHCLSSCNPGSNDLGGAADCKADHWCNGGVCEPLKANGDNCTASFQCASEICNHQDGVCCDDACELNCYSCKLAGSQGSCTLVPDGLDPDSECAGGGTCGGTCDGTGSCQFPTPDQDCGTCERCNGAGFCKNVSNNSDPFDHCALCQTCNGNGHCKYVPQGADIHEDCDAVDQSTCGYNGQCDGGGACDYYELGKEAKAPNCAGGVKELEDTCDGHGNIVDGGDKQCKPYICVGDDCGGACTGHGDCADGFFCDFDDLDGDGETNDCVAKRNNGSQCHEGKGFECKGGYCNNGFCCASPTGDCCNNNGDCSQHAESAVCDYNTGGGCGGHRVDAYCDGNKVCQVATVDDASACASNLCSSAHCDGLVHTGDRYCDASGSCSLGGSPLSCDDANICTDDSCSAAGGCQHADSDGVTEACYTGPANTAGKGQCSEGIRTCSNGQLGLCSGQVVPDTEVCGDGVDNDCDDATDEENSDGCGYYFKDEDQDGVGANATKCLCGAGGYLGSEAPAYTAVENGDCDDSNPSSKPGNPELCDTPYDDNCNSLANEDGSLGCSNYYFDGDSDGYGVGSAVCKCGPSDPYDATTTGDCNDGNNQIYPGKAEKCNGFDDNCNGTVDTAEASAATMCGDPAHGEPGCSAGVCYLITCEVDWFNMDGLFSNGCEAGIDQYDKIGWGDFCGHADLAAINAGLNAGSLPGSPQYLHKGQSHTITSTIVPHGDVDWYKAQWVDNGTQGRDFHLDIRFKANPGDGFRFNVYRDSCGNKVCSGAKFYDIYSDFNTSGGVGNQNCSGSSGNDWCGSPGTNCCHKNNEGANRWFFIEIYRPDGKGYGPEYQLFLSNNIY